MNSELPVYTSENGDQGSLGEILNADVAERRENSKGVHHEGDKFGDIFQLKHGSFADLPAARISEMMKVESLENASTQSLFAVVSKILDESIERKNGDIPLRVASLLKLVVQEIEQRVSKYPENMKKQSNLFKSREERYQSKIRALETLTLGSTDEKEIIMNQLQQMKIEKVRADEERKEEEHHLIRIQTEKDHYEIKLSALKQEMELAKKTHENNCSQLEIQASKSKADLQSKILELELLLNDSRKKVKELENFAQSKSLRWRRKEHNYQHFIDSHQASLQDLRTVSDSIKKEILNTKMIYIDEINQFGWELKGLVDAAQNYHAVLAENRKLYNEIQDLKGNIRVYCRIRPFLPGQSQKQTTIEYIGENGELIVTNPLKQGKDNHRLFKFNKVFGPAATQEEVFLDTRPLIRSVLDGFNVCIFAYGQTGSGKTYTMSGPSVSSVEDWGVNYRALNDLFDISRSRKSSIKYEIGVQMVEIYNEQVRDLLSNESSQKRLGIWNTTQPNGLAVPDASMHPVKSTADVLEFMKIGLMNRVVGATALNERSSRSHSVLTVHVFGTDLKTNAVLRGCLHLIDLAGSERVDRSEATGDRLKEAQHINKSLSALGDVIFALAQKNSHVPYRNSKLTQVLQSSLGGQAKTIMFVQLNPDLESYSETVSTLKFAERVSGVELGAARVNKEGRGIRELMEQVASLKDQLASKDEEIGRLRLLRPNSGERHGMNTQRYGSASPRRHSVGTSQQSRKLSASRSLGVKAASDLDNSSECSDRHSDAGSQQSVEDFKYPRDIYQQSRLALAHGDQNFLEDFNLKHVVPDGNLSHTDDPELLGFGDADSEERLSDISDSVLSMGTETDGSVSSIVEYTLFPEAVKQPDEATEKQLQVPSKLPRPQQKPSATASSQLSSTKSLSKTASKNITSQILCTVHNLDPYLKLE
ncbi:OLC1v1029737C1 [Oldenlandia corymbosa var. corymbosa]|uniref:OLC1v1029737C1 n=1 Tax=Oldenlandia corymbosa var. corymbosa TaxID=529605 RepID=A0AAV1CGI2_OLDCO|nr:OLC1v1029737C1 [Oldenlandia corymbosa var. corymbosa]